MIKVLGIDPSLSNFGFAMCNVTVEGGKTKIDVHNLILTATEVEDKATRKKVRKNSTDLERARILAGAVALATNWADVIAVEVPVGSQSARAMASYGICIGVLASITKPLLQLTPTEVKLAGFGDKNASKEEMISWATSLYPQANWLRHNGKITQKNEHLADAVAAVHAATLLDEFKLLTAITR